MPNNVKTYDGSEDLEYHLKNFQTAAKVERWAMPTWCHMFNSTLTRSARVWFKDLHPESIDSYDDLKKSIPSKLSSTEEVHQGSSRNPPYKVERRGVYGRFCAKGRSGSIQPSTKIGTSNMEIARTWEKAELRHKGKLSEPAKEIKKGGGKDQPKAEKKGETSGKDKAMEILMVQPWQKVPGSTLLQKAPSGSKEPNGSSHHTPHWFHWRSHMANGADIDASKNKGCRTFNFHMDEFHGSKVTISVERNHRKDRIIPLECAMVSRPEAQSSNVAQTMEERIKIAIHHEYSEQTIVIGSTLT
ncbi:hypothetical protein Tco_0998703 [Tanacetum coccineum]